MAKTYIPMAVDWAQGTYKRLTRYQAVLTVGATPSQLVAFANLLACLATFLQEWHKPPPNP